MKALVKNNNQIENSIKTGWWFGFFWLAIFIIAISVLALNFDILRLALPFVFFLIFLVIPEEYGLYVLAFFLPTINWNFYYHGLEIPLIDLLGLAIFSAFALKKVYARFFDRKNFNLRLPLFILFLPFLAVTLISVFSTAIPKDSLWYILRWILFFYFVYLVLPVNIVKRSDVLKNSIACLVFGGMIVAIGGFLTIFSQDWNYEFVGIMPFSLFGFFPLGSNHNLIAETLVVSVAFTQSLKYWLTSLRTRRFLDVLTVFQFLVAIGTFSRAVWIAFGVMIIICLIVYRRRISRTAWVGLFLISLLASPIFLYMYKLQSEYSIGGSSTENRLIMTEIAWDNFLDKPLFGQGSGTFINFIGDSIRFTAKYGAPLDSHGVWQKMILENGLFGVFTFALIIGGMFIFFARAWVKYGARYPWFPPLILGVVGIMVMEFFNTSYYKGKLWLPVAFCLVAINIIRMKEKQRKYAKK
ncbi:MAG: O-antigen ligase family protein [Patescibacteria group bacterium]|jgi:O-antigen ligase